MAPIKKPSQCLLVKFPTNNESRKINKTKKKAKKIANPPIKGIGIVCIFLLELGLSTIPNLKAIFFTIKVKIIEKNKLKIIAGKYTINLI